MKNALSTAAGDLEPAVKEVAVLVHGTFAAADADEGEKWWQTSSRFFEKLRGRLSDPVELLPFHWSGNNSEYSRIQAGKELLARLLELERQGCAVHLIGHSHGGSVIWHALKESLRSNTRLQRLRSWTTIGTPFLTFGPKKQTWLRCGAFAAKCVLVMLLISTLVAGAVLGIMWMERSLHKDIERLTALIVGGWLAAYGMAYYFHRQFAVRLSEYKLVGHDVRLGQHTLRRYGWQWLSMTSANDEAVNGLCKTVQFDSIALVPPWRPDPFFSDQDWLFRWSQTISKYTYGVFFDHILRPAANRAMSRQLQAFAQGNDLPGRTIYSVQREPLTSTETLPTLPEELDAAITDAANLATSALIPRLRSTLLAPYVPSQPLLELAESTRLESSERNGGTAAPAHSESLELTGAELVHTSYYENAEVIQLVARHMAGSRDSGMPPDSSLAQWYELFIAKREKYIDSTAASQPLVCNQCGYDEPTITWKVEPRFSSRWCLFLLVFAPPIGVVVVAINRRRKTHPQCPACGAELDPGQLPTELLEK